MVPETHHLNTSHVEAELVLQKSEPPLRDFLKLQTQAQGSEPLWFNYTP